MGLDIYLYRYSDYEKAAALENEYEAFSERLWNAEDKPYESYTDAEKDAIRSESKQRAERLGLNEWGEAQPPLKVGLEEPSAKYPNHLFKRGYFRSSYNGAGFNNVTQTLLGKDGLYWIFDRDRDDDYAFVPDWSAAKGRADELTSDLSSKRGASDNVFVIDAGWNIFDSPEKIKARCSSKEDAVRIFRDELAKKRCANDAFGEGGYSNANGEFYLSEPLEVLALVPGVSSLGAPTTYTVCRRDDNVLDSYIQSAEIVSETCAYVLATGEPELHRLHWSS